MKDKKHFVNDRLKVGDSKISGKGVFATRPYEAGEVIEICPYIAIYERDIRGILLDYVFEGLENNTVLCVLGYGMLYNHSNNPNLETYFGEVDTMEFVALRRVEKGEELTHNYGNDWWNRRFE
jgi:SET domain-containing protein